MKSLHKLYTSLVFAGLLGQVWAEDIDIFQYQNVTASQRPNVLILLDNTANWNTPFRRKVSIASMGCWQIWELAGIS